MPQNYRTSPRDPRSSLAALAALCLAACSAEVSHTSPNLDEVAPGYACRVQQDTAITLTGDHFGPLAVGLPDHPTAELPTIRLTLEKALDGAAASAGTPVVYDGTPDGENAALLAWDSPEQMRFKVTPTVAVSGKAAPLARGVYGVTVADPVGGESSRPGTLALVDAPAVEVAAPGLACLSEGPRTLTLTGTELLYIEDRPPTVRAGEDAEASPITVTSPTGCTDVPHATTAARFCTGGQIELAQGALAPGFHPLTLTNPAPADCHTETLRNLRVVPPPSVALADPPVVCPTQAARTVTLTGTDLLRVDDQVPFVSLTDADGAEQVLSNVTLGGRCEPLETEGHTVERCDTLTVELPVLDVAAPYRPTLTVKNPDPAGCQVATTTVLTLVPSPVLEAAVPPGLCDAQGDRDLELRGAELLRIDGATPAVTVDGVEAPVQEMTECEPVDVTGAAVERCHSVRVLLPAGTAPAEAGAWAVPPIALTNPEPALGATQLDGGLVVFPPPVVSLAEPPLVCLAQGERSVRLTGAGLVVWEGATPAVSVGDATATVDAATACEPAPVVGAAAEVCTTLDVTLADGALMPGVHPIRTTSPDPVGCVSDGATSLRVVPPPALTAANPPVLCAAEGPREVVLSGVDLLRVGDLLPSATMTAADGAVVPLEVRALGGECEPLETTGLRVERCTTLTVVVPAQNPDAAYQPTIAVTNPAPAGCEATSAVLLTLVPAPTLAAVTPSLLCTAQGNRAALATGTGLLRIDGRLPAFTVDGGAVTVTGLDGCTPVPAAGAMVESCTSAALDVPDQVVADGATHAQPIVAVVNPEPAGCGAVAPADALTVTPAPTTVAVTPPYLCLAQGERTVALAGTGLLAVDGTLPAARAGDVALGVEAPTGCTPVPVSGHGVESCTGLTLRLPQGALAAGAVGLTLTNPDTAGCETREALSLTVLPAPSIADAEPSVTCTAEGEREVVVHGADFVRADGALPTARLREAAGETEVAVVAVDDCADALVADHDVALCQRLTLRLPARVLDAPVHPTLIVTNPPPADCTATGEGVLHLVGPPTLDDAGPAVVCQEGAEATLAITGSGFVVRDGTPPSVDVGGAPSRDVRPTGCVELAPGHQTCTGLEVAVDPAVAAGGTVDIRVTNPDGIGCSDAAVRGIAVLTPPRVDAVDPTPLCTDDGARRLTVRGAGFVDLDGRLPSVVVGERTLAVESLADCVAAQAGPLAYRNCRTLTVEVPAGALTEGTPRVTVVGPAPAACSGGADGVLTVPPALALTSVTPDRICSAAGERVLEIRGRGFLTVDGVAPTVDLGGQTFGSAARDCAPLAVVGHQVQVCQTLGVTVPQNGVPAGPTPVAVTNPGAGACGERVEGLFTVVPMPRVDAVEPDEICEDGHHELRITGAGFLPESLVTLGAWPATSVVYVDANTLVATFPDDLSPGLADLTVDNGDGCVDTLPEAVDIHPMPIVFFVDPPVVWSGLSLQVTVYTSGLDAAPREVRIFGPDGSSLVLDSRVQPDRPNKVLATLPAGLQAGEWSVQVTSRIGCVGALPGGFTVTDRLTLGLAEIDPDYVSPSTDTAVTLRTASPLMAGQVGFVSTPRAYLNPHGAGPGVLATAVHALVFRDAGTLTGVVPAGMTPGAYDVVVVNPDGAVGVLSEALHVTADEPPIISAIEPASLDGNGPQRVRILGQDFDAAGASVSMTCLDGAGGQPHTEPGGVEAGGTDTEVVGILPADRFTAGTVCTVTLTNADGASFRFSAVSIKTPAQNLADWTPQTNMVEARRALGLVAGRPTFSSRFLYAIGGDGGAVASAKRTVEAASVDTFGDMGSWSLQRNALPQPRTFAGSARIGRFAYLVGGNDGAAAVNTVLRAEILDPLATPEITDISLSLLPAQAGLPAGLWHYRVSATFAPDDASNPGGESLPGEVLVADLPQVAGLELRMEWSPVPGATGYRIYRTARPGDSVDALELLGTTAGETVFVDRGAQTDPAGTPLLPGSTGVWHVAGHLTAPREAAAVVAAPAPPGAPPGTWYLYAFGGRSGPGTDLANYEFAAITVDDAGAQAVGPFAVGAGTLGTARGEASAFKVGSADISNIPRGQNWLFVGPGRTAGGFARDVDAALVTADGNLGAFIPTDRVNNDFAGYSGGAANGYLFVVGGRGGSASSAGVSAELCRSSMDPGCNVAPIEPADIRNWNALGSQMSEARIYAGSTQESAFFFSAGGFNGATTTHTVDRTVQ